jgi:hypothetical protein
MQPTEQGQTVMADRVTTYIVFMTDLSSEAGSFASVIIRPSTI